MNIFRYLQRQFKRLKIDLLTQGRFLAGGIPSIDNDNVIKTVSTNYEELEIIFFKHFNIRPQDVIVDVGCGKGRVFNYLLYKGIKNTMIGYEINPLVGNQTAKRLARYKNVIIRCDNIFDDFPPEGNVFYLYNPFKDAMTTEFSQRILKIANRKPVILYNNPLHLNVFDDDRFEYTLHEIEVPEYGYTFSFAVIRVK
jgi:SAM-dependent methyltransferase